MRSSTAKRSNLPYDLHHLANVISEARQGQEDRRSRLREAKGYTVLTLRIGDVGCCFPSAIEKGV